jgi:hypothetical protein
MQYAVERSWVVEAHAGIDAVLRFFERDRNNAGHIGVRLIV